MLRMPEFQYHHPRSAGEAVAMWHDLPGEAMYIAGGTDLLPNIKHRLHRPDHLVGLGGLPRPRIADGGDHLLIDAGVSLHALASAPVVQRLLPPLAQAAGLVAGPQIRRMGTLGGNILLDTRCLYYNQSQFWRQALGYCLKREGDWCHVVGGPKTCVAAQSADTVPVLLALSASIELLGPGGVRELAMRDLYRFNGMDHLKLQPGELLTRVRVPKPQAGFRGRYLKLRQRDAIDFPQLGLAVTGVFDGRVPRTLEIVVGAANPQPKPVRGLDAFTGRPLDEAAIEAIAALVYKRTRPQGAVAGDVGWRRQMAAVFTRRALLELRGASG